MHDQDWLAQRFEDHRSRLAAVAYRMLGSRSEADDAVQEAWLRLSRADSAAVHNLGGWLTTVVGRVCLDMLRSRSARPEQPLERVGMSAADQPDVTDPEHEALMAESIGLALLVVLDTLAPAERLAFVLHDLFAVPFSELGAILDRSPNAAKQLASRARRRVQATHATPAARTRPDAHPARQTQLVNAFLTASRDGDFATLLGLLDPDVVLRADPTAVKAGARAEVRGAPAVAQQFAKRALDTLPAVILEAPDTAWAITRATPPAALHFHTRHNKITHIDIVFDPQQLRQLDLVIRGR